MVSEIVAFRYECPASYQDSKIIFFGGGWYEPECSTYDYFDLNTNKWASETIPSSARKLADCPWLVPKQHPSAVKLQPRPNAPSPAASPPPIISSTASISSIDWETVSGRGNRGGRQHSSNKGPASSLLSSPSSSSSPNLGKKHTYRR